MTPRPRHSPRPPVPASPRHSVSASPRLLLITLALLTLTGCPQYRDPTVPGEIRHLTEPVHRGKYYIYVPTTYDPAKKWSLIVVAHGTVAFDTAKRQIRDWAKLAEEKQFIVVAPVLKGVSAFLPPPVNRQLELQREDERRILACMHHVRGAYNIAPDRIFLTGWSAGNFAVLYTGLRHPDLFRALAVLQGNFDAAYLGEVGPVVDPFQPVYVLYGSSDVLTGRHGQRCVDWLNEHRAAVTQEEIAGAHKNHPKQAYAFFERVVRKVPWLHIRAITDDPANPLMVRFKIRSSFEPEAYAWSFGDGSTAPVATPTHVYPKQGKYTVTLDAQTPQGKVVRRAVEIDLPQTASPTRRPDSL
ncbi:MAG: PKD domain-containing protein [bacterium]|nr:PKD domain-containing protein [bacterium]